jgi:hypothetical protein
MKSQLPDRPFFIPPLKITSGGVDFLGLREVDLQIRDEFFPGFNTRCEFIRPFAVMSWTYWKFYQLCQAQRLVNPTLKDMQAFSEKVEILVTWGHRLKKVRGVPGLDAEPPKGSKRVPLTFKAWGRIPSSTSLMAPVQYGPAMKTVSGLNFLEPLPGGFYRTVGAGVDLALALEGSLSRNSKFKVLNSLTQTTATEEDAVDLFDSWSVESVTKAEKKSFLRAFYDENLEGTQSGLGKRSTALGFVLAVLRAAARPLTIDQLRRAMFYCYFSSKHPLRISLKYRQAHLMWMVLHVRRAHRLGLEALFSWVERQVLAGRRTRERIVEAGMTELINAKAFLRPNRTVLNSATAFFDGLNDLGDLIGKGLADRRFCPLTLFEELRERVARESEPILPSALTILLLCSKYASAFARDGAITPYLELGGAERVSISYWKDFVEKYASRQPHEFLSNLLEYLVVSQHFSVATRRYDGGTQRLRISIEEEGLASLTGKCWNPPVTVDKLYNAVSLMSECDLVELDPNDWRVSLRI